MFSKTPELYDTIYGSFKDYRAESARIAALLAEVAPDARVLLDVACGTGEHIRHLRADHGYDAHGLDIEPAFLALARAKVPDARFWQGDMADFDLDARFDVILCLFSSIGYLTDLDRVERALRCFRRHLRPGGLAIVEPWFEPEAWIPGRIHVQDAEADGVRVIRMSYPSREGNISRLLFHYLVGTAAGIEHRVEHHALGLFTTAELLERFRRAGFERVEHDPEGLIGRGLFLAFASPRRGSA